VIESTLNRAVVLPPDLTTAIDEQQRIARQYLPNDMHKAVISIHAAWKLLPAPKFSNSASVSLIRDCVYILNLALKHDDAKQLLERWITDLEARDYPVEEPLPYLLIGETCLFLEQVAEAGNYLQKAFEIGGAAAFAEQPALYLDIATQKTTDQQQILQAFEKEDLLETWFQKEEVNSARHTLSKDMFDRIEEICEEGGEWFDDKEYTEAISTWQQAFNLVPEPQHSFSQSLWLHSSIGDAFFLLHDFKKAAMHLLAAAGNTAENAHANSLLMLRLGQSCFEINDIPKAKEYLLRAYILGGEARFENEDEKYLDFLGKHVNLQQ
jgi:tetratricopeptide (TPR) repeat protein